MYSTHLGHDWQHVPGFSNHDVESSNEIQKHPRYDDILWLRKWKGKKIVKDNPREECVVEALYNVKGTFYDKAGYTHQINQNWVEIKEEPKKRVPLTAKDFQNIRSISGDNGCEYRILTIDYNFVLLACIEGIVRSSFELLAKEGGIGITFDNKTVPLYREE